MAMIVYIRGVLTLAGGIFTVQASSVQPTCPRHHYRCRYFISLIAGDSVRAGSADQSFPFSAQHMDGSEMMKLVGWAQSVVTFTVAHPQYLTVWPLSSVCTGARG